MHIGAFRFSFVYFRSKRFSQVRKHSFLIFVAYSLESQESIFTFISLLSAIPYKVHCCSHPVCLRTSIIHYNKI